MTVSTRNTDRRLRVGFVLHIMQVAGAEVLVREIIHQLADRIDPFVLCLDGIGPLGESLQAENIPVIHLHRRPGRDWGVVGRMADCIRRHRIEILHAHQYTPFFYSALARVRCLGKPRLIFTEHGRHYPDHVSRRRRWMNRLLLRRLATAVNACCHFSARALADVDGFSLPSVEVIENGIDLRRYAPRADRAALRHSLGLDPARRYVGCVARFHPVKDHAMLLRGFAAVAQARPDVDLLLVGDGPLRADLQRQAAELGVVDRVRFLGVRSDIPDLLQALDVFALTSVSEAASLTVLEAMASRLPVVVTAVGGNPEMVRQEVDGLLVPRGDDRALASALLRVLDDPAFGHHLGEAGRARVEQHYQLANTVDRYGRLYRRLMGLPETAR